MADVFAITCKRSTDHTHLTYKSRVTELQSLRVKGCIKIFEFKTIVSMFIIMKRKYIYICKIHNAYSI